jgi:hypothetical protein
VQKLWISRQVERVLAKCLVKWISHNCVWTLCHWRSSQPPTLFKSWEQRDGHVYFWGGDEASAISYSVLIDCNLFNDKGSNSQYKAVSVLQQLSTTPWRRMRERMYRYDFLDLGTSNRWVVSFTPQLLYVLGNSPGTHCIRRLGGPQNLSGQRGAENILDSVGTQTPVPL